MERTKYTPKRLLSLLLALIMLLGMFPTATLAAGTEDGIVLNSGEYKNSGLFSNLSQSCRKGRIFKEMEVTSKSIIRSAPQLVRTMSKLRN